MISPHPRGILVGYIKVSFPKHYSGKMLHVGEHVDRQILLFCEQICGGWGCVPVHVFIHAAQNPMRIPSLIMFYHILKFLYLFIYKKEERNMNIFVSWYTCRG